jgi:hypothetical protein
LDLELAGGKAASVARKGDRLRVFEVRVPFPSNVVILSFDGPTFNTI